MRNQTLSQEAIKLCEVGFLDNQLNHIAIEARTSPSEHITNDSCTNSCTEHGIMSKKLNTMLTNAE